MKGIGLAWDNPASNVLGAVGSIGNSLWFGKSDIIGISTCYVESTWRCRFCDLGCVNSGAIGFLDMVASNVGNNKDTGMM